MQIIVDGTTYTLPNPTGSDLALDPMVTEYTGLNGVVKRDHRSNASATLWRGVIRWGDISKAEADDVERIWLALTKNPAITGDLTAPNGRSFTITLATKERAFSREPFATGDGQDRAMVSLVLNLEELILLTP